MANQIYGKTRQKFLTGALNWLSGNTKIVLVDTDIYTPNFATDEFLADIPVGARVATSTDLVSKTATLGAADADDITITGVSGATVEAVVMYVDTGSAATSTLLTYWDTASGLVLTPNGGDVVVQWSNGDSRIFRV